MGNYNDVILDRKMKIQAVLQTCWPITRRQVDKKKAADDIHEQNACDINNMTGHTNMFMLCDDEWITPIKYEIVQKRRL